MSNIIKVLEAQDKVELIDWDELTNKERALLDAITVNLEILYDSLDDRR